MSEERPRARIDVGLIVGRGLTPTERTKAALLSAWFFVAVATLWLLKPVRVASLLAHLGAAETPYVRLAGVATLAVVVLLYTRVINQLSRVAVARGTNLVFGALLVLFWLAFRIAGPQLGAQRWFVWAVYILVEIYSVVLIGVFWTYANDVVTPAEANRLYGVIGLGGILGGAVGGAFVDVFAKTVGNINLLLVCAGLVVVSAALATACERILKPPPRHVSEEDREKHTFSVALDGAREVLASRYLLLLVGIVVAYEFTATLTDFGINVVFERAFHDEGDLAKMYGRLGWIVSVTAVVSQLVLVPLLLPSKRLALSVPPFAMIVGAVCMLVAPLVATGMLLAAADRGLNYSIQQATKESLYVPLTDSQKYKSKAFIDMFVDRLAKALAAFVLIGLLATVGESVRITLVCSIVAMGGWFVAAQALGRSAAKRDGEKPPSP